MCYFISCNTWFVIYIYTSPRAIGPSPGPVNRSPTEPGGAPDRFPHMPDRSPCSPAWDGVVHSPRWPVRLHWPRALSPSRALIEPTRPRPSRLTPHAHAPTRLSHFVGSLSRFDKAPAIFQFLASHFYYIIATMLNHYYYSAQPF
jgi:hypothetical protein